MFLNDTDGIYSVRGGLCQIEYTVRSLHLPAICITALILLQLSAGPLQGLERA